MRQRVDELRDENNYQTRIKEMNYDERIRDLTDKFMQEMENLKTKNTVISGEKEKEASKHAEQIHDLIEKQNKELQDLGKSNVFLDFDRSIEKKYFQNDFHRSFVRKIEIFAFCFFFLFVSFCKNLFVSRRLESSNNQKLMLEYEKYQDLQAKTQKTQEEYERQITELENRKEEEVTRQRMQYTAQLEKLKNDLILVS